MGGSDVIEAAALAKPLVVGPHVQNFADAVEQLGLRDGLRITTPDNLAVDIQDILDHPDVASCLSTNAKSVVQANLGATDRTMSALLSVLSAHVT